MFLFELKDIEVSFGNVKVLKGISFRVKETGLLSIVGKSGCGKSTLLNVLYGLEKPTKGSIVFRPSNISQKQSFSCIHKNEIAMVFQHYNLFDDLTALDNVVIPLLIKGEKRRVAIDKAVLLFKKFKLEKIMKQSACTLSGGEKQRVAILRSLVIDPKVILCDEPTGALDKANSLLIMDMFKEISKTICVILVSHNLELVNKYSDRVITLKDGKITDDISYNQPISRLRFPKRKKRHFVNWTSIFVRSGLKHNKTRNILTVFALSFGFISLFLSYGFSVGSKTSAEHAMEKNLSIGYSKAYLKNYFSISNSPLTYEKSVRPSVYEIDQYIGDVTYLTSVLNLEYAFPSYPKTYYSGQEYSIQFIPLFNNIAKSNTIIINDVAAKTLGISQANKQEIIIENTLIFKTNTGDINNPFIKDQISYALTFHIVEIVHEFSFLNTPKIYYSYSNIKDYLNSLYLENISRFKQKSYSVINFIEEVAPDDLISSYSMNVFLDDYSKINEFYDLISELKEKECVFQIDSTDYEIKTTYVEFMNAFSDALLVFSIIAFIGIGVIIGMLSLSSYIKRKKESAILTCLGANSSTILSIFLKENYFLVIISFLVGFSLFLPITKIANFFIESSFGLNNVINMYKYELFNIPYLFPFAILVGSLCLVSIFILIPMFLYRNFSLTAELRDE